MSQRGRKKGIYQFTTHVAVVVIVLIMFVSAAYIFYLPVPDASDARGQTLAELEQNRDTWHRRRPLSYRYVVDRNCSCARPVIEPYIATEQQGDRSAVFRMAVESEAGGYLTAPPDPIWIDELFALLEMSLLSDDKVRIAYDPAYGFPTFVEIAGSDSAADVGDRYEILDFTVLEYR